MKELFDASFSPVNIIASGMLLFTLVYWLTVIIGLLDLNFFDFDVDLHAEVDISTEVDVDTHVSISWFNYVLSFFNIGKVPFMVFLSFFALSLWVISVMANHYLGNTSFLLSLALFVPNFFVSLFAAKFLTIPFIKIFTEMDKEAKSGQLIGREGKAVTDITSDKYGQVSVLVNRAPAILNAVCMKGLEIERDDTILVIDYIEEKRCYLVEPS